MMYIIYKIYKIYTNKYIYIYINIYIYVYIYICIIYKNVYIYVKTQIYEYIVILDLTNARTHTLIVINVNSIPSKYTMPKKNKMYLQIRTFTN